MNNTELTPEQIAYLIKGLDHLELWHQLISNKRVNLEKKAAHKRRSEYAATAITAINQLTEQVAGLREDIEGYVQANTDLLAKIDERKQRSECNE